MTITVMTHERLATRLPSLRRTGRRIGPLALSDRWKFGPRRRQALLVAGRHPICRRANISDVVPPAFPNAAVALPLSLIFRLVVRCSHISCRSLALRQLDLRTAKSNIPANV